MFILFSKLLLFLLSPAFWIIVILIWSFITKYPKRKKSLRIISAILFIVFSSPFLFNLFVTTWQPEVKSLPKSKYSACILLGGMSRIDKDQQQYFTSEADRFIQTAKLYHTNKVNKIIISGGSLNFFNRNKIAESVYLKNELKQQAIPDSNIIIEINSRNTFENALYTKKILDSLKLSSPYLLVSSAMHLPRAQAVFAKAGIETIPVPAAFKEVPSKKGLQDFLPSIYILSSWNEFLKEVVGLAVYKMTGKA